MNPQDYEVDIIPLAEADGGGFMAIAPGVAGMPIRWCDAGRGTPQHLRRDRLLAGSGAGDGPGGTPAAPRRRLRSRSWNI